MDAKKIGRQIAALRKMKGLTQSEMGERLNVSFQAVSKWERGETMPDTGILVDLADVLETTVDNILRGGEQAISYKGKFTVEDMRRGLLALKSMGEHLGQGHPFYRFAIEGINVQMNTTIQDAFSDERIFECFVAEAIIASLNEGKYIDLTDVKNGFQHEKYRNIVLKHCERCGIV